jgi:hypothetical protein
MRKLAGASSDLRGQHHDMIYIAGGFTTDHIRAT